MEGHCGHYPEYDRALILLSRGGADATVVREFDLIAGEFVTTDAFTIPEAKTDVSWVSRDALLVGTDLGADTLTASGYPRQVRLWSRGSDLAQAEVIFAGEHDDVAVGGWYDATEGFETLSVERAQDFYNTQRFVATCPATVGTPVELTELRVPSDCRTTIHREWLVLLPRTDFAGVPAGGVGVVELEQWLAGTGQVEVIFTPDAHTSFQALSWTANYLIVTLLHNVATELRVLSIGSWEPVPAFAELPADATISVVGTSSYRDDEVWVLSQSMLSPATLWHGQLPGELTVARRAPALFDATGMSTRLHSASSADGTKIPYRVSGLLDRDTPAPTLVHAYGGFEVSLVPTYSALRGIGWLTRGGIFVEANLRGGGEIRQPQWHSLVVKTERMRVYEDHQAVLADLVRRGYCTREQLAVRGGSNGGLLTAVALTLYPDLIGAAVSQVPLADMMRYHRLSAGAPGWLNTATLRIRPSGLLLRSIPRCSGWCRATSAPIRQHWLPPLPAMIGADPAHARSLAWLLHQAEQPVDYYENMEGGHAGAADNSQVAFMEALIFTWLWQKLPTA